MGVIKGSESTLDSPSGCLDRGTYEALSTRTQSRFAGDRSRIYTLFETYRKLKPVDYIDPPQRSGATCLANRYTHDDLQNARPRSRTAKTLSRPTLRLSLR